MFNLSKITTQDLIQSVGILLTLVVIGVSISQFSKNVSNSISQAKKQTALEQTSELPLQVSEFCINASNVATVIVLTENGIDIDAAIEAEFKASKEKQDELLPIIKNNILAYGSNDALQLFIEFEKGISNSDKNQIDINVYYLLPLLLSQVKMDVTGEVVDPMNFLNSLMPQFKEHNTRAKEYINELIIDLNLDKELSPK